MKIRVLVCVLFVAASAFGAILEEGMGIVYGGDHAFSLKAPKGWVLDNESAVEQGIHAVFYPKGSSWQDSSIVAYARSRPKTDKISTAEDAAKDVVRDFHANGSPKYAAKRVKTLKTDSGGEAVIYHFTGDQWGNSEAVAYFVEKKTINFIVLNSRKADVFRNSLKAFDALAKSYQFMGDQPLNTELDESFENVCERAKEMGETPEGRAYEKKFTAAIGKPLQSVLKDCTANTEAPYTLNLVFVISTNGVAKIVASPNPVSECVAEKLKDLKLPKPPKDQWMVALNLTVK